MASLIAQFVISFLGMILYADMYNHLVAYFNHVRGLSNGHCCISMRPQKFKRKFFPHPPLIIYSLTDLKLVYT